MGNENTEKKKRARRAVRAREIRGYVMKDGCCTEHENCCTDACDYDSPCDAWYRNRGRTPVEHAPKPAPLPKAIVVKRRKRRK